jgi:hypothetical protein
VLVRVKVVALQPGEQWVAGPEQPPLASSIKFSVSWRSWALESALFRFPCARQRPCARVGAGTVAGTASNPGVRNVLSAAVVPS